jgi:hypothetical protein
VLVAEILRKCLLELLHLRPSGEPTAAERINHFGDFVLANARLVKWPVQGLSGGFSLNGIEV